MSLGRKLVKIREQIQVNLIKIIVNIAHFKIVRKKVLPEYCSFSLCTKITFCLVQNCSLSGNFIPETVDKSAGNIFYDFLTLSK